MPLSSVPAFKGGKDRRERVESVLKLLVETGGARSGGMPAETRYFVPRRRKAHGLRKPIFGLDSNKGYARSWARTHFEPENRNNNNGLLI
jgi:hypothetical protein